MCSTDFTGRKTSPCYAVIARFGKASAEGEPQSSSVTLGLEYTKSELEKPARFGVEATRHPHSFQNDGNIPSCDAARPNPEVNVFQSAGLNFELLRRRSLNWNAEGSGSFRWRFETPTTNRVKGQRGRVRLHTTLCLCAFAPQSLVAKADLDSKGTLAERPRLLATPCGITHPAVLSITVIYVYSLCFRP